MTKKELQAAVDAAKAETKTALETMYAALSQTKRTKVAKDEKVKAIFERHGVEHSE